MSFAAVVTMKLMQQMYQCIDSLPRREIIFDVSSGGPSSGISIEVRSLSTTHTGHGLKNETNAMYCYPASHRVESIFRKLVYSSVNTLYLS